MMLWLNDEYLWDYNVDVVVVVDVVIHCWCRQVVEVVRCCWLSCWVHAYSYKVRSYAPVLILGVYAPALIGTTCILHSQVVAVSLHCR